MNQIPKGQAATFMSQMVEDYVRQLERQGHKAAAALVRANGLASVQSLADGHSTERPPDASNTD